MKYDEFITKCKGEVKVGYMIVALTDTFQIYKWDGEEIPAIPEEKMLEIRVFDIDKELKLFRSDIGKELKGWIIRDKEKEPGGKIVSERSSLDTGTDYSKIYDGQFDENQYLDIDLSKGARDGIVTATGGGKYRVPLSKLENALLKIRYYLGREEESGQARIADWRMVCFMEGGDEHEV